MLVNIDSNELMFCIKSTALFYLGRSYLTTAPSLITIPPNKPH